MIGANSVLIGATTGMKMEKITAGIPNSEAAAGEVNADSITWVYPLFFVI